MVSYKVTTDIGKTSVSVMNGPPLKPVQDLELDLSNEKMCSLITNTSEKNLRMAHLANALHSSYDTPGSAIRDLVLAFNEDLPKGSLHIEKLRNGLSHTKLRKKTISDIESTMPFKLTLSHDGEIDSVSSMNFSILTMENFDLLHNAIDVFRKELREYTSDKNTHPTRS
ncbi:MAG: hypothetical protein QXJ74_03615 [Nitrososphaera sp.]